MSCFTDVVRTEEFDMPYIKFGKGEKTLVILPGLSLKSVIPFAEAIEKQYEIFCSDYTVYLFERRENLPKAYSVYDMANDTAKAIKTLGLYKICLFGVSQGGMIAMLIAVDYPELVSKLALGSTACRVDNSNDFAVQEWIKAAKEENAEALCLSFGRRVYSSEVYKQNREALIAIAKTTSKDELQRFLCLAEGTPGFDMSNRIREIRCPVLVIGDNDDNVFGAEATLEISNRLSKKENFEIYMYSGYGHAAYDTAPDYAKRLFAFFNK